MGARLSVPAWLRRSGTYLVVGAVAIVVYGLTIAPSLTWSHLGSDGGDLVTAAATGRVAHPPGFPLYFLTSRMALSLVHADPAAVLNCLSSVAAVGSALLVTAAAKRRGLSDWVALVAALTLLFSAWFWAQAVITEVYTAAALLTGWVLWLSESPESRDGAAWALTGFALGLAASVHPTTILLLPYVCLSGRPRWRSFVLGLLVGLVPYAALPLFGPWPQPWGDLGSVGGWLAYVSARIYWGNAFSLPLTSWPSRLLAWGVLSARQFTPVGAVLVLFGAASGKSDRRRLVGAIVSLALVSIYAIGYNSPDSWVYLVAFLPLVALYFARGLQWAVDRGLPAALGGLIPIALVLLNARSTSLAADRQALTWLDTVVDRLPQEAVVLTAEDRYTFALWYVTEAVDRRPDLLVVDTRLWGYPPYVQFLERREGRSAARPQELAAGRPLCEIDAQGEVKCL